MKWHAEVCERTLFLRWLCNQLTFLWRDESFWTLREKTRPCCRRMSTAICDATARRGAGTNIEENQIHIWTILINGTDNFKIEKNLNNALQSQTYFETWSMCVLGANWCSLWLDGPGSATTEDEITADSVASNELIRAWLMVSSGTGNAARTKAPDPKYDRRTTLRANWPDRSLTLFHSDILRPDQRWQPQNTNENQLDRMRMISRNASANYNSKIL